MEKYPHICFDIILPQELNIIASQYAFQENSSNVSPFEAASVSSKLWSPGRTITVCFLEGLPEIQNKVEYYAHQWEQHANIVFKFVNTKDADIRISFQNKGSWSAVGTDALVKEFFPKDKPTMNYGWLRLDSPESEYSRVVLHEFGHALGMIHEHSSPVNGINWNKEAVYEYYSGAPNHWDRAKIDHNILTRYSSTQTQFTKFDPKSIMLYHFPTELTLDKQVFQLNNTLSETDKEFISARYPFNHV